MLMFHVQYLYVVHSMSRNSLHLLYVVHIIVFALKISTNSQGNKFWSSVKRWFFSDLVCLSDVFSSCSLRARLTWWRWWTRSVMPWTPCRRRMEAWRLGSKLTCKELQSEDLVLKAVQTVKAFSFAYVCPLQSLN